MSGGGLSSSLMHGAGSNDMLAMLPAPSCDAGALGQLCGSAGPRSGASPLRGALLLAPRPGDAAPAADQAVPTPDPAAGQVWEATDAGGGMARPAPPPSTYYWQLSSAERLGAGPSPTAPPAMLRPGAAPAPPQHPLC